MEKSFKQNIVVRELFNLDILNVYEMKINFSKNFWNEDNLCLSVNVFFDVFISLLFVIDYRAQLTIFNFFKSWTS